VPGDPKMVVAPLQAKELATFSLTSLECAPVRHLSLQPDLGIPLSYLDMGVYAVPDQPQALAPEDAALVEVSQSLHNCTLQEAKAPVIACVPNEVYTSFMMH